MKKVFLGSFITIVSVSLILSGIYYYQKIKMQRSQVVDAIPPDAALILQTKDLRLTLDKLRKSKFWNDIHSSGSMRGMDVSFEYMDSLLSVNKDLDHLLKNQAVTVSMHKVKYNDFDYLFLLSIPEINPEAFINKLVTDIVKDKIPIAKRIYGGITIIEVPFEAGGHKVEFTYTVLNGLFVGSFSSILLESSIREIRKNVPHTLSASFRKVMDAAGSNVDANVYINYSFYSAAFGQYLSAGNEFLVDDIGDFASWSEFDIKIRENAVSFSGLTSAAKDSSFLACFSGQQPQQINVASVLPYTTAFMMYWGLSDFNAFNENYKRFLGRASAGSDRYRSQIIRKGMLKKAESEFHVSVEAKIFPWIGNEIAMVTLEPTDTTYDDNVFAVIHARNMAEAKLSLAELTQKTTSDTIINYQDYAIGSIKIGQMIPALFGRSFAKIRDTYYTFIGNYVVFGNKISALKTFIDENISQQVLSREQNYQKLAVNVASKANFYLYSSIPRSMTTVKEYASDSLAKVMDSNMGYFSKFNAVALQYVSDPQLSGFFNNFYLQNASEAETAVQSDVQPEWSLDLDADVSMTPQFVVNHLTGEKEIIVQDDDNKLYLLNREGEILWSRKLPSRILGPVYQVDAFRNDRLQYMFNTRLGLYLVDRNGDNVEHFPVKFPVPASNAIAVFDYDNTRDYRIFVGGVNGVVYGYQVNGKPLEGWTFTKPIWPVKLPVQHFVAGDKDYLFVSDSKGITYILDRKGDKKAIADKPVYRSKNNQWVMDVADQPYFVTTDSTGNIFNLYLDGHTEVEHIADYRPSHFFDFRDINGDHLKDYIILNEGRLFVCNQDTSRIFDYTLQQNSGRPNFSMKTFVLNDEDPVIGVVSSKDSQLFLFNKDGSIKRGFPVKGSTGFSIDYFSKPSSSKRKPRECLVVGSGRTVLLYSLR